MNLKISKPKVMMQYYQRKKYYAKNKTIGNVMQGFLFYTQDDIFIKINDKEIKN